MTATDFTLPFSLGVVSSLHCIQMCGPIVLACSLPVRRESGSVAVAQMAYNAGRVMTYSALGAAAGAAGGAVGLLGKLAGIEHTAAIVAGLAMMVAGVFLSGLLPRQGLVRIDRLGAGAHLSRAAGRFLQSAQPRHKLALGLVLGFLPCGLIYAALLKALETGSALSGAMTMFAFGLGTVGAMLLLGLASSRIPPRLSRWSNPLAAASVTVLGAVLVWRGMMPVHCH